MDDISRRDFAFKKLPGMILALYSLSGGGTEAFESQKGQDPRRLTVGVEEGDENYMFNFLRDMTVDSDGNMYLLDQRMREVRKFSPAGDFISKFGSRGNGPGEFRTPLMIRNDGENCLYIYDLGRKLISKFDLEGNFIDVNLNTEQITPSVMDFHVLDGDRLIVHGFNTYGYESLDDVRLFHLAEMGKGLVDSFGKVVHYEDTERYVERFKSRYETAYFFQGGTAVDASSGRVYHVPKFRPKRLAIYDIGEDLPSEIFEDDSLSGRLKVGTVKRDEIRKKRHDMSFTPDNPSANNIPVLDADQTREGDQVFLVGDDLYSMAKDRKGGVTYVRGYSTEDGRRVFNRDYDFDPLGNVPKLCYIDPDFNAYFVTVRNPFPHVVREPLK